jgi:hypothetical protein
MFSTIKSAGKSLTDAVQGMMSAGLDKVKVSVEEFAAASSELEEIGYRSNAIELCCALSPSVTVFLTRLCAPSDEAFQGILARPTTSTTLRTVVSLLRQTEKMIAKFDLRRQQCTSLALELGVPPRVRLIYTDKCDASSVTDGDYVI